jgi:hypothetical protein
MRGGIFLGWEIGQSLVTILFITTGWEEGSFDIYRVKAKNAAKRLPVHRRTHF